MIFAFAVKHLRWLTHIPWVTQCFDAALLLQSAVVRPGRLRAIEEIERTVLAVDGARLGVHRYGGTAFLRGGHEFAHLHGNGLLDVKLTPSLAAQAIKAGHAEPHHFLGRSNWVSVWIGSERDVERASALLRQAASLVSTA